MKRSEFFNRDRTFRWVDVTTPSAKDLKALGDEFGLHKTSIQDCLEPFHLPKYEQVDDKQFMILRVMDESAPSTASTIVELTRKIALFSGKGYLLSVHRKEISFLSVLQQKWAERLQTYSGDPGAHLRLDILSEGFHTFNIELNQDGRVLEELELAVFELRPKKYDFHALYQLKRRASVCRRLLQLSFDAITRFSNNMNEAPIGRESSQVFVQDLKDDLSNTLNYSEDLLEGLNQLVTTHHSLESQKANEVMRMLALFSAFFFPLSLIAGIYGMNFKAMPELEWAWGYPFSLALMAVTALGIYIWFKIKKWI